MKLNLTDITAELTGAVRTGDAVFTSVSTDTRTMAPGALFVAIRGETFDAHDFLGDIAGKGASCVMAERVPDGFTLPHIIVPDTKKALGELAAFWRSRFPVKLIAVTGSNGKTTVKEMIRSILVTAYGEEDVLATKGNLNNDIGVPLTLFGLRQNHVAVVCEIGMNHPGEMAALAAVVSPTVALVNNAQREHQEFMGTVEATARENGAVLMALPDYGTAVFPGDDPFTSLWDEFAGARRKTLFGFEKDTAVSSRYTESPDGTEVAFRIGGKLIDATLATKGVHNVRNAMAAAACCYAAGIDRETIVRGLEAFRPVAGRLFVTKAACGACVIDDTYNANPDSALAAIDVLAACPGEKIFVFGDMGEVGPQGPEFHAEIGRAAKAAGIDRLFALGELSAKTAEAFGEGARHFSDMDTLSGALREAVTKDATVLVKGSRFMRMERAVKALTEGGAPC